MSRSIDFLKGLFGLAAIIVLLVGIPAALLITVGYPLPTEAPDLDLMRMHIEQGNIPDQFVVKTLAVIVWVVWFQLALALVAEVFAAIRGRVAGRAPVLPGLQLVAAKLVASTVLIISALTPTRSATAAPIVPLGPAVAADGPRVDAGLPTSPDGAVVLPALDQAPADWSASINGDAQGPRADGQYRTTNSDSWWDMAERLLGDGMRWSELRDLNQGKVMLTGEVIDQRTETVGPGWLLDVPPDAPAGMLVSRGVASVDLGAPAQTAAQTGSSHELVVDDQIVLAERAPVDSGSDDAGPLIAAIKPFTLVYEGPTGAVDNGIGVPYQVVEGDNLWDIAERHLGDPFRWPEIFENSRQLDQTFGRTITDPNLIWPDSILWLPSDAVDVPMADPALVEEVVGVLTPVTPQRPLIPLGPDDIQGATDSARQTASDVGLPGPGQPTPTPDPDPSGLPVEGVNGHEPSAGSTDAANDGGDSAGPLQKMTEPAGLAVGVGGSLAVTGLLGLLARGRRMRQAETGAGSVPAPPSIELTDIETVLRNSADRPQTAAVHAAVRSLAARPVQAGEPVATPEVLRASAERIEVVQTGLDGGPPAPWMPARSPALEALADRSLAVLATDALPPAHPDDELLDTPAPAMVSVGRGLMVNLESIGVFGIDGPPALAAGLVRSMVHELASGPGRRSVDIHSSAAVPAADLHHNVRCGPLMELSERLSARFEDAELALAASGAVNVWAHRAAELGSTLPPSTIVFATGADAARLGPLLARAARRSLPLAVVVVGELEKLPMAPAVTLRLAEDKIKLEPHGFTAAAQSLDTDLLLGAAALIEQARQAPIVARDDLQLPMADDHETDPAQIPTEETPEHEIVTELPAEEDEITDQSLDETGLLIRVLGPVSIEGCAVDVTDGELSLLAYLALVGPSTGERLRDAVWPVSAGAPGVGGIDDDGFRQVVERLKAGLGPLFVEGDDGRFRLRSAITDLGSARRWIDQAASMSDQRRRNLLQLALTDVRGRPFADVSERHWQWVADHQMALATQATSLLVDACFDLCDNAYDADDLHLAKWACDVAGIVDPLNETVLIRRVQLIQVLATLDKAGPDRAQARAVALVEEWEDRYSAYSGRPAPQGPRLSLQSAEAVPQHAG